MKVCGIIAEYDPFHTGHASQIASIRETLGSDCAIVCVMSGNFTQRGSCAIAQKHLRTRLALMGGADLVLELPLPFAISSAQQFARGGVEALAASGAVTHLCFGSESGDLTLLQSAAHCLDDPQYPCVLRGFLDQGLSFPAARQAAAERLIGPQAQCLSLPNNNLGVEYLCALNRLDSQIIPFTVMRRGAGHGEGPKDGFASASHLRTLLRAGQWEQAEPFLLPGAAKLLKSAPLANLPLAERAILARLRQMTPEEFALLPDCGEGLSNRLYQAVRQGRSLDEILTLVKTKRYPHARLRRILLWAFLGMSREDLPRSLPYLRVLGMNETGRTVLRTVKQNCPLPILTKPAHAEQLSPAGRALFRLDVRASDLYALCLPEISPCGAEWTQGPIIL